LWLNRGLVTPHEAALRQRQAVTNDAALSICVGEAAKYKSACVNTLRRPRAVTNSPAPERNLLEPFHIQTGVRAMKQFSTTFLTALIGMSIVTGAYADERTITQEEIDRIFIGENKLPGKTLQCYQAGQEIIHEFGLRDFQEMEGRITATRLDGSVFEMPLNEGDATVCTIKTREAKN